MRPIFTTLTLLVLTAAAQASPGVSPREAMSPSIVDLAAPRAAPAKPATVRSATDGSGDALRGTLPSPSFVVLEALTPPADPGTASAPVTRTAAEPIVIRGGIVDAAGAGTGRVTLPQPTVAKGKGKGKGKGKADTAQAETAPKLVSAPSSLSTEIRQGGNVVPE